MLKKDENGNTIEPIQEIGLYIKKRLDELKWMDKLLVQKSGLSKAQISKLKNGQAEKLTAKTFFFVYSAFGDSCLEATKIVYPNLDITLNEYEEPVRNDFGTYMSAFEVIKNSVDIIAARTGIDVQRLKDLYYRKGAPEAYELLFLEKAIGKESGEVFKELYGAKREK